MPIDPRLQRQYFVPSNAQLRTITELREDLTRLQTHQDRLVQEILQERRENAAREKAAKTSWVPTLILTAALSVIGTGIGTYVVNRFTKGSK